MNRVDSLLKNYNFCTKNQRQTFTDILFFKGKKRRSFILHNFFWTDLNRRFSHYF